MQIFEKPTSQTVLTYNRHVVDDPGLLVDLHDAPELLELIQLGLDELRSLPGRTVVGHQRRWRLSVKLQLVTVLYG